MPDLSDKTLDLIEKNYLTLEENFYDLSQKCANEDEHQRLVTLYNSARDTYWKATKTDMEDHHDLVLDLMKQLKQEQSDVADSLKGIKSMTTFLDQVTSAVKTAASIVTLVAA